MILRPPQDPLEQLPLAAFAVFYVGTFACGAVLLLWGPALFERLFTWHMRFAPIWLSAEAVFFDWILIIVAPLGFVAGWFLGRRRSPAPPEPRVEPRSPDVLFYGALYAAFGIVGCFSLTRVGAVSRLPGWLDKGVLVQTRFMLLERLTFAEWVNLYVLLPTAAGLLFVRLMRSPLSRAQRRSAAAVVFISLLTFDLLLFQKRYVILSAIFLATCALMSGSTEPAAGRRLLYRIGLGLAGIFSLYGALLVASSIRPETAIEALPPTSLLAEAAVADQAPPESASSEEGAVTPAPAQGVGHPATLTRQAGYYTRIRLRFLRTLVERWFPGRWIARAEEHPRDLNPHIARLLFLPLLPSMRTAPPALVYPMLFPRRLPFFGLDVGQDLAGIGRMPDDNIVVYAAMYRRIDKATSSVPFQFAWFSQIGLAGALLLSVLLGFAVALAWKTFRNASLPAELRTVLGALLVLFCVHITQESVRGGLINSYGVAWGLLLVAGIAAAVPALTRHVRDRPTGD